VITYELGQQAADAMTRRNGADLHSTNIGSFALQAPYGLAPFNSSLFGLDGSATSLCRAFYEQYCRETIGLVTIGGVAVSADGRANGTSLVLQRSQICSGIASIKEAAHDNGVALAVQIEHAGRQARTTETGARVVGPTSEPCPVVGGSPHTLGASEIRTIVAQFREAAAVAARSGADFVEINAAHGYLVSGFLSAATNSRIDQYGGSVENRFRFLREILVAASDVLGAPLGVRVNVRERAKQAISVTQLCDGLAPLRDEISYISVSAGMYATADDLIMPARHLGENLWADEARKLRNLGKPILLAGNILDRASADSLIAGGSADVVLFGRALLADPRLLESADPQPCTDCGMCKYRTRGLPHLHCPFNPVFQNSRRVRQLRLLGRPTIACS
jgi:2,4-dienoyl-CoA reductase-like NADH-dependent reductase (Old Yellow Enzyme family)